MEFFGNKSQKPEARSQKPEARSQKPEARSMMKQRSIVSRLFACILFFIGLLVSCGGPKIWKVGFIGPMSGRFAGVGKMQMQSAQLAIQEFEEKYGKIGGRDIQLVVKDSLGQAESASAAAAELIQDERITGLIGPLFSNAALAVAGEFQQAEIPMISVGTNPYITENGDYIFRTTASDSLVSRVLATYLVQETRLPNLAIVHTTGNKFSETFASRVASVYEGLGKEVLINLAMPEGAEDFAPYLEELAPLSPAAIFLPITTVEFTQILPQLRSDQRFQNTLLIGADGLINQDFLDTSGDMAEGIIVANTSSTLGNSRYFHALYKVSFGMAANTYSLYVYDATTILLDAMHRVYKQQKHINGRELREQIRHARHVGVSGRIEFAENGDAKRNVAIFKVRTGRFAKQGVYTLDYSKLQRVE